MAFLRHFDVKLVAEERPEMLLGGHATDHDPSALRYYYSDFLLLPEFMPPFQDTNPIVELDQIREYIEMIQVCVCVPVKVRLRVHVSACIPSSSNLNASRHRLSVARAVSPSFSVSLLPSRLPASLCPLFLSRQPRTRLDTYPLFIILKGVLRKLMDRETYIVSARERELKRKIDELLDEKAWMLRRHRCSVSYVFVKEVTCHNHCRCL